MQHPVLLDSHHVALRSPVHVSLRQRGANQLTRNRRSEHVQSLSDEQCLIASEVVPDRGGAGARVRQDGVSAGAIQRCHVPTEIGSGDDPGVRSQTSAVPRQVDVHAVIVGRDQDRAGISDSCLIEDRAIGGIADDICGMGAFTLRQAVDDRDIDPIFGERPGGGSTNATATDDDRFRGRG